MILNDVYPIDERGATLAEERELIERWESRCAAIISWTKVVERRR